MIRLIGTHKLRFGGTMWRKMHDNLIYIGEMPLESTAIQYYTSSREGKSALHKVPVHCPNSFVRASLFLTDADTISSIKGEFKSQLGVVDEHVGDWINKLTGSKAAYIEKAYHYHQVWGKLKLDQLEETIFTKRGMTKTDKKIGNTHIIYGSLREGHYNYNAFKRMGSTEVLARGELRGYKMWDLGAYPCITYTGNTDDIVQVEVHKYCDRNSTSIARMEIGAGYVPIDEQIKGDDGKTHFGTVWVYPNEPRFGKEVEGGDWTVHVKGGKVDAHSEHNA